MASFSAVDTQTISEIRETSKECLDRGLLVASKWYVHHVSTVNSSHWQNIAFARLSELLLSVSPAKWKAVHITPSMSKFSTSTPARSESPPAPLFPSQAGRSPILPQVQTSITVNIRKDSYASSSEHPREDTLSFERALEKEEEDTLFAARSCFEAREFYRATHLLKECKSSKARFLKLYCQFIVRQYMIIILIWILTMAGYREKGSKGLA